jgi:hypothetical protein
MKTKTARLVLGLALSIGATGIIGCSSHTARQVADKNRSNIERLSNIYAGFQNSMGGRGPKDEAEFRSFIQEYDKDKLAAMGIDTRKLDELFTSERDGKPFKIRYKIGGGHGSKDAVIFEETGMGGIREVGITGVAPMEVGDDATYQNMLAGKGFSAPAPGGRTAIKEAQPGSKTKGRPVGGPPPGAPTGPRG